jgi:hypothetical protein
MFHKMDKVMKLLDALPLVWLKTKLCFLYHCT